MRMGKKRMRRGMLLNIAVILTFAVGILAYNRLLLTVQKAELILIICEVLQETRAVLNICMTTMD